MSLTRKSCALPDQSRPKPRHFYPLIGFVVPTLVVGYGIVIPRNGIAGFNELTVGFASTVIGACLTYVVGLRAALRTVVPATPCERRHRGWRRPEFLARQAAHPTGLVGWILAHIMAVETAPANEQTIAFAELTGDERVLEVGCGHGRATARIARALPKGHVVGLDPSATMVRLATRNNRHSITEGKVRVEQGDAATLPYSAASFDRILATHTVYFWRDIGQVARELRRVLKPHGRLVFGFGDVDTMRPQFPKSVYALRSADEIRDALKHAGFTDVRVETRTTSKQTMHWTIAS